MEIGKEGTTVREREREREGWVGKRKDERQRGVEWRKG